MGTRKKNFMRFGMAYPGSTGFLRLAVTLLRKNSW